MWGQFLATFAGVILSFLLWFGSEKIFQYQREKKARAHLYKEIIEEINENIILLGMLAGTIEKNLNEGRIPLLGLKLNISARSSAISSGELRLINNHEQRQLIRNSTYNSQEFNHFVENTEFLLATVNLKAQAQAIHEARYRLNQLKEQAKETATYLRGTVTQLTDPKSLGNPEIIKEVIVGKDYEISYAASIMVLITFLVVVLKNQWRTVEGYIAIALISIMILFFAFSLISIHLQNRGRNKRIKILFNKLTEFAFKLKIRRIELSLGFVALIIALLQLGYPWGLLVATILVIVVDIFLFWPALRKRKKAT